MLWFQLEYVGTLNFSMSALQYMPALLSAMSCIYLLSEHKGILGALACFVLAVASSGNGLFLIPVGFLMLLRARRHRHLVVWIVTSALVTWLYFYQYDFSASARPNIGNQGVQFGWDALGFLLSFVGGILSIPTIYYFAGYALLICPLLGTAICVLLFYAYRKGYFARNRTAGYCALFLLITAAAVSVMRAGFGAPQGLASRYGMNSALLLIFVWFAVADSIKDRRWNESRRWLICSVFSLAIAVVMDVYGYRYLVRRNADIRRDMAIYHQTGATPMSPHPNQPASFAARQQRAPRVLETSVKLGLYKPTNF
jgi:hypothetical protein